MKVADPFPARKEMAAQVPGGMAVGERTDVTMEDAAAAAEPPEADNRSTTAIEPDPGRQRFHGPRTRDTSFTAAGDVPLDIVILR